MTKPDDEQLRDIWYEDVLKTIMDDWHQCRLDLADEASFDDHVLTELEHGDHGLKRMAAKLYLTEQENKALKSKVETLENTIRLLGLK